MNKIIKYKGYIGSVEFSKSNGIFYGKVQGIRSLISYEGTTADELVTDFHEAVDSYKLWNSVFRQKNPNASHRVTSGLLSIISKIYCYRNL